MREVFKTIDNNSNVYEDIIANSLLLFERLSNSQPLI